MIVNYFTDEYWRLECRIYETRWLRPSLSKRYLPTISTLFLPLTHNPSGFRPHRTLVAAVATVLFKWTRKAPEASSSKNELGTHSKLCLKTFFPFLSLLWLNFWEHDVISDWPKPFWQELACHQWRITQKVARNMARAIRSPGIHGKVFSKSMSKQFIRLYKKLGFPQ